MVESRNANAGLALGLRMMIAVAALCFLWAAALFGEPPGASIEGRVESQRGTAVGHVNIVVKGTAWQVTSSNEGHFELHVPTGTHTLVVSRIGFQTVERQVVLAAGAVEQIAIVLVEKPLELQELVVERQMVIGDPRKLDSIPGSAHYIGPEVLERQYYDDIHRILEQIPGVNVQEEDGYGLRPNIGLRGTGSERSSKITVMEDGVLIAPAPYAAPAAYYFPTAGRMQGVEVRKGSSQIKYGPFTTGGALNLVSTKIPTASSGRIDLKTGEDNERRVHAVAGDSYANFGWMLENYQTRADGFKDLDGGGNTGFDKKDYIAKFRLNSSSSTRVYQQLTFKVGRSDEVSNETYLGLTDIDFERTPYRRYAGSQKDVLTAAQRQYRLSYFVKPSNEIDLTVTVYRNDFKRNWYKLGKIRGDGDAVDIAAVVEDPETYAMEYALATGTTGPEGQVLEVKANNREYSARGVQLVLGFQGQGRGAEHELEFGLRYHEDEVDRFQWVDQYRMEGGTMLLARAGEPGTESNRIQSATALALFLQHNLVWGKWSAVPGLRYEAISLGRRDYGKADPERTGSDLKRRKNEVEVWIPGIGLGYRFAPYLNAFLGVHKGFAPPGDKEGTAPEESYNYELGLRYDKADLRAEGVLFFNDYTNLLGSDLAAAGGTGEQVNGGAVDVFGLELTAATDLRRHIPLADALPASLAYTYTRAEFRSAFASDFEPWGEVEPSFELPYIPRHRLTASLGLEQARWAVNLRANYVGKMRTRAGRAAYDPAFSTDARLVLDTTVDYAFASTSKMYLSMRNLTNRTYIAARRPAGMRPGLPRIASVGIKTSF